jgi:hypothetical protein
MPSFATKRELAGLKGLLGRGAAVGTGVEIFKQGQPNSLLEQALRSIPNTSKTDAGRLLGNFLMNEANYMGKQLQKGVTPYNRPSGVIGSIPPSANGESYRRAELRLADAARPGGGGGGGGNAGYSGVSSAVSNFSDPAAQRAYQQEVSRTAQLTAQDPELKRYKEAREKAAAQGFTPESVKTAEDIGMQIWAKKYGGPGGLASKVKPGQAGYDVIQNTINPDAAPQGLSDYGKAGTEYDYRDYGEPPNPTVGYQMQSPAITGVAAQTVVPQLDPAQMKAQNLVESFKQGVFDPDLMEQIANSIYNR